MIKRLLLTAVAAIVLCGVADAQVTTTPKFIPKGYEGEVVVTFDPSMGNKGMVGATDCYAHTGLITEKSSNDGDWKYAPSKWLDTSEKYRMTKKGEMWELRISNINEYYGCPKDEEILRLAFVFNDGKEGGKEGKTADGKDIFVDLMEKDLFVVKFDKPTGNQLLEAGSECEFVAASSQKATITLSINDSETANAADSYELTYKHTFAEPGDYRVTVKATAGDKTAADTVGICIYNEATEAARPEGLQDGITYYADDPTRATLSVYAKDNSNRVAKNVFVVGDFNDWTYSSAYQMKRDGETGYFWIDLTGLTPGEEYVFQYAVTRHDGSTVQISDPYTEKVIDNDCQYVPEDVYPNLALLPEGAQGPSAVLQTAQAEYEWSDATLNFKRPAKENLIIYEVWVYDFSPYRSIAGLTKRLDYIENLGVNAIELMPVCEFEGNISWGYNPTHYFALDKAYGTKEDFKEFVDECHKRGIAVIMDMVFNHCTGLNPMNKLFALSDNPYFNVTAPHVYKIFEDFNHEFDITREHFTRVLRYWQEEYKVDGYRMDVSHGLCGYDCDDIVGIIDRYYQEGVKAVSEDAYFILEHWPWDDRPTTGDSERQELVDRGMMCWTNTNKAYSQTAKGRIGYDDDLTAATYDGYVTYCGSHDEERNFYMAKSQGKGEIRTDTTVRLSRIAANMAMNVMLNGPQMIWQFDEIGYDISINYNMYNGNVEEAGRTSPKPMPEGINYLKSPLRMGQYQKVAQMLQLRTRIKPEVFEGNPEEQDVGSGEAIRSVTWGTGVNSVFVVSNLDASSVQSYTLPEGTNEWYDYLTDSNVPQGNGTELSLKAGEVKVWTGQYIALPEVPDRYVYTDTVIEVELGTTLPESKPLCSVYPTVASEVVYVVSETTPERIEVIDLMGRRMVSQPGHDGTVDVSTLQKGLYIVVVTYERRQESIKIYRK